MLCMIAFRVNFFGASPPVLYSIGGLARKFTTLFHYVNISNVPIILQISGV